MPFEPPTERMKVERSTKLLERFKRVLFESVLAPR